VNTEAVRLTLGEENGSSHYTCLPRCCTTASTLLCCQQLQLRLQPDPGLEIMASPRPPSQQGRQYSPKLRPPQHFQQPQNQQQRFLHHQLQHIHNSFDNVNNMPAPKMGMSEQQQAACTNSMNSPAVALTRASPTKRHQRSTIKKNYEDGEYEGDLNAEGERDGSGIMKYLEGDVYEGEWKEDVMEGLGTMVYDDGDKYTGHFLQGNFDGAGEYWYRNGDHYKGEWKNDAFDGDGMYSDHKGSKYEGAWKEDKMHGRGKYLDAAGNIYEGTFHQGKFHGAGKLNYVNGDFYEGEFRLGKRHGQGKCIDVDGNAYDGQWLENKRNGYGTFRDVMGGVYKGHYKGGSRDGPGTYLWPEGQIDVTICKDDVRVGVGVGWSGDRKRAWRMVDGEYTGDVSLVEAHHVVGALGIDPEEVMRL
jgi:hypothetical protein